MKNVLCIYMHKKKMLNLERRKTIEYNEGIINYLGRYMCRKELLLYFIVYIEFMH